MITIILRTVRDRWRALLTYSLISLGMTWMYIALFPSFASQAERFNELFASYPKAFLEAFGIENLSISTVENFLTMEQYSLIWPLLTIIFCLSLAGSGLAAEVERETIVLTLGQPISRSRVYWARWLAGAKILTAFTALSVYGPLLFARFHDVATITGNYHGMFLMAELYALAIFSFAFLASAFFSDKGRVSMVGGGLFLLMYVANIVAGIRDSLDWLRFGSFFNYFKAENVLVKGEISTLSVTVFVSVIVLASLIGWFRWNQRDIS